ncbi:MAG: metal-dependent transcriptional regulator [Planctomycetota bacterium]|nr:metal-dependent transcriptional regulator [Planctomycetota bacterium]
MEATSKIGQLTPTLEDYLESIYHLSRYNKAAHSRDIAEDMSVHKSTVTAALKSLSHLGMINYAPYEAVTLTGKGEKIASDVVNRHRVLKDFFTDVLLVDAGMSEKAACGMEHAMPREILERLVDFARFIKNCPGKNRNWLSGFTGQSRLDCRTNNRCPSRRPE